MALTACQDKCCHVALNAVEIWNHLQEAVKLLATYYCHVMFVPVSLPVWKKKEKQKNKT